MDEAFTRLRLYARERNAKLTDVADALVTRALPVGEIDILIGPPRPSIACSLRVGSGCGPITPGGSRPGMPWCRR